MDTFYSLETKHYESSSSFAQNSAIAAKSRLWMTGSGGSVPSGVQGQNSPLGGRGNPLPSPMKAKHL